MTCAMLTPGGRGFAFIGYAGENLARQIRFDISAWVEQYGAGTLALLVQRQGDAAPYIAPLDVSGGVAVWTITATDTAIPGRGKIELQYLVGDVLVKSCIWTTHTDPALDTPGPAPVEPGSWVQEVLEAADRAEAAAESAEKSSESAEKSSESAPYIGENGHWYVYSPEAGGYVDTGVSASGADWLILTQEGDHSFSEIEDAVAESRPVFFDAGYATGLYPLRELDSEARTATFSAMITALDVETGWADVFLDLWLLTAAGDDVRWNNFQTMLLSPISADFELNTNFVSITNQQGGILNFSDAGDGSIYISAADHEGNPAIEARLVAAAPIQMQDGWLYKVYADGTFEAWYKATGQSITITALSGSLYRSELQTLRLPSGMTVGKTCDIRHVSVNVAHNNYPAWGILASIQTPEENTFKYYAASGGSRTVSLNYTVTAYVFGTLS